MTGADESARAAQVVRAALEDAQLDWSSPADGQFFVKLPGTHKLMTGCWLVVGRHAMLVEAFVRRPDVSPGLAWPMLTVVVAAQALRWWCIATLGRRWNTRVIVVPGLAPVRSGPYRWLSHPNYVAVVAEGVALPLVHASWVTALVFTLTNAALLTVRLRAENAALATLEPARA